MFMMPAILLISSVFTAFAHNLGEPLMATRILKNLDSNANMSQHKCHEEPPAQKNKFDDRIISKVVNTSYFNATVECEIKCRNKKIISKNVYQKFEPQKQGLSEGDGSTQNKILWRSLGTTLDLWSKKICQAEADKNCDAIEDFQVKKISSGTWSMTGSYNCQRQETIYSPFDEQFDLDNKPKTTLLKVDDKFSNKEWNPSFYTYLPKTMNQSEAKKYILSEESGSCKKRAKIFTCFGDCVFQNEKQLSWNETLMTVEHFGSYQVEICLDDFAHVFQKKQSKAQSDLVCHQLIWEIFRTSNALGTSCAAFRYDYQCPSF
jgi:hypothetical protein